MDSTTDWSAIAIVGVGCRFPGNATSPAAFWQLLSNGIDAIRELPADRFDLSRLYDPDPATPGKIYVRRGGFIDGVDAFDAGFFGISPREATVIDPQHRLLLEVAYEALEDAGIALGRIAGTPTGVFVGISTHDYGDVQMYPGNRKQIGSHSNSGTATSIAANRISYAFDLRGPSMTVDTACSSSLTAVHLAVQSLRGGECQLAVVGGVQLVLTAEPTIGFCKASMLSPDAQCRAFDASANGYVRSEGAGVVVLKPLAAALRDQDAVYAVIRSTAINQDGHTTGMTVPSGDAQAAMLRLAVERAGLDPSDVDYVEAHGTGTPVGDPIEAGAIGAVLGRRRSNRPPCIIGSVKTNIGHLEAASGMAGLIKTTLALAHRQIPPTLHFTAPNPAIDFEGLGLRVPTALEPWPERDGPATAGVNSFGFGGANAHVILQEAPAGLHEAATTSPAAGARAELLTISAQSPEALTASARAYLDFIASNPTEDLANICGSAALRRSQHPHRAAIVAATHEDMADALDAFIAGEQRADVTFGRVADTPSRIAFVFGGMGAQWWGMGRQLMRDEPVFRHVLEQCDALLRPLADWSLMDMLNADETSSRVAEADVAQVTNFAIQAALVALWKSWGVVPDAVLGHSAGGIAAAHVAGAHDLADTILLAYHRSRLQSRASGQGTMLAVGLSAADAERALGPYADRVSLGAVNSPTSCVLSGDAAALSALLAEFQGRGVFARLLHVAVPYHSVKMDPIRDEVLDVLRPLVARKAVIGLVSDVTGAWADGTRYDAAYWWQTIRQPVRFADGVATLIDAGFRTFVEVGPHPVLSASVNECLAARGEKGMVLPSIRRQDDDRKVMLRSLGALAVLGHPVQWPAVQSGYRRYVKLPAYPWQHERHWFESRAGSDDTDAPRASAHPLLGDRMRGPQVRFDATLRLDAERWTADHVVDGTVVFPAAGYVEMALAAAREADSRPSVVRELELSKALFLPPSAATIVQTALDEDGRFTIHGASAGADQAWTLHARGRIERHEHETPAPSDIDAILSRLPIEVPHADYYAALALRGLAYGPSFKGIDRLRCGGSEALGHVDIASLGLDSKPYSFHPALLDACFQVLIAAATGPDDTVAERQQLFLPVQIDRVSLYRPPRDAAWSHARVVHREAGQLVGDVDILDEQGSVCATIRGLRCKSLAGAKPAHEQMADWLYEFHWEPAPPIGSTAAAEAARLPSDPLRSAVEVQATADAESAASGWQRYYTHVEPLLERLAAQLAADALRALGWESKPGDTIGPESLSEIGIVPAAVPLAERLLAMLADQGFLTSGTNGHAVWRVAQALPEQDVDGLKQEVLRADHAYESDVALILRSGAVLAGVLRGETIGQDALFGRDAAREITRFYRAGPASAYYGKLLADALAHLVGRCDPSAPIRILEVGGGTGGTTAQLLAAIGHERLEYTFTDVSPFFTSRAEQEFGTRVTARTFDIAQDPRAQGFMPGQADIVVAANVVHATPDLAATLTNLRSLLAPGGLLVLLEITRRPRWLDVVFGVTEGWWRFRGDPLRPDHALLEPEPWRALLRSHGFTDVALIADEDHLGMPGQSVLLAQAGGLAEPSAAVSPPGEWLILADRGGVGARLAEVLRAGGASPTLATADDAADLVTLLDAIAERGGTLRGAVVLTALDAVVMPETGGEDLVAMPRLTCEPALRLVTGLRQRGVRLPGGLWLITAGAQSAGQDPAQIGQSPLWGLGRVVMREQTDIACRLVDLDEGRSDAALVALVSELSANSEEETALRGEERWVRRMVRLRADQAEAVRRLRAPKPEENWQVEPAMAGALSSIAARAAARAEPRPDEVEIAVAASGLNFRDIMLAAGMIPSIATEQTFGQQGLGLDCAGTVVRCGGDVTDFAPGDAVIAIAPNALSGFTSTRAALVVRKPAEMSFTTAAAIPCAFVTAHYALNRLAQLRRGERVLIHAATGGVGLAAIQIAQRVGAEIFATAGSAEKRAHLAALGIRHIMDSRSLAFAQEVLDLTAGEGVDVVLNSLAGEAIPKGIGLLRPYGRFVEIGKRDIYGDSRIGLLPFRKNISFFAVDLDRLCNERPELAGEMLREVVKDFAKGRYTALPERVFPVSEAEPAVRHMAQARHIGKIVLNHADSALQIVDAPQPVGRGGTYLISGGSGGFGFATARWLAEQAAGAVVLIGRSELGAAAQAAIEALRQRSGAQIEYVRGDVARRDDVARIIRQIRDRLPPLRGVIHCAMVLDDAPLADMHRARLEAAVAPKLAGAWNLHRETLDETLDLFVCYSSIAAILGNPMQANYAAANTCLDALAHHRRAQGRPALTVHWGVVQDAGYVARHPEIADYLGRQGYGAFSADEALAALTVLLKAERTDTVVARIDWQRLAGFSPVTIESPSFRNFAPAATAEPQRAGAGALRQALAQASEPSRRMDLIEQYLRAKVGRVLGIAPQKVDRDRPLTQLGLDSLIAVELVVALKADVGFELPVVKLLQGLSIQGLATQILASLPAADAAAPAPPAPSPVDQRPADPPEPDFARPEVVPERQPAPLAASIDPRPVPRTNGAARRDYGALDHTRLSGAQQAAQWCARTVFALGTRISVEGEDRLPPTGSFILAVNHLSLADVPLVMTVMRRPVILMAAEFLRQRAVTRWLLGDLGNAIFVQRGEADLAALDDALAVLRAGGIIGMSPEGKISRAGALLPAQTGVAYLATLAGVPVLPVGIWGQERLTESWARLRRPAVHISVGTPLQLPAGPAGAPELQLYTAQVMQAIASLLPTEYRGAYQ